MPGAVRASTSLSTTGTDVDTFLGALQAIAGGGPAPFTYDQDPHTGDYWPRTNDVRWATAARRLGASCARG